MRCHGLLICAALLATAGALAAQEPACSAALPDSLAGVEPPVHTKCTVTTSVMPQGAIPGLEFPVSDYTAIRQLGCVAAEIGFVVDERGRVEERSVILLETNQAAFGAAVVAAARRLRFRPARLDNRPVRQWVTFVMSGQLPERAAFRVGRVGSMAELRTPADPPIIRVGLEAC